MGNNTEKKTLLLHSCCGPCSTAVLERLAPDYQITVFFANSNITDQQEFELRLKEQKRFLREYNETFPRDEQISFLEAKWDPKVFYEKTVGLESEPEGGLRCEKCFEMRLTETAELCRERKLSRFATTLSVSPHKNVETINRIGTALAQQYGLEFMAFDLKKQNGYQRSIQLSKEYKLYRQKYCGCEFSKLHESV